MAREPRKKSIGRNGTPPRAWGYCRVSTGRQSEEGQSLSVQEENVRSYAPLTTFPLADVFVERGVSGGKPLAERPEGARLLASIKSGDAVIITRLDRMFRDAADALVTVRAWRAAGVKLHVIEMGGDTSGTFGGFILQILAAVADIERVKIRERIREVKESQRARGRYLGGKPPAGATITEAGDLDMAGAAALRARVIDLAAIGWGCRRIAAELNAAGHAVSKSTVANMLRHEPAMEDLTQ